MPRTKPSSSIYSIPLKKTDYSPVNNSLNLKNTVLPNNIIKIGAMIHSIDRIQFSIRYPDKYYKKIYKKLRNEFGLVDTKQVSSDPTRVVHTFAYEESKIQLIRYIGKSYSAYCFQVNNFKPIS